MLRVYQMERVNVKTTGFTHPEGLRVLLVRVMVAMQYNATGMASAAQVPSVVVSSSTIRHGTVSTAITMFVTIRSYTLETERSGVVPVVVSVHSRGSTALAHFEYAVGTAHVIQACIHARVFLVTVARRVQMVHVGQLQSNATAMVLATLPHAHAMP